MNQRIAAAPTRLCPYQQPHVEIRAATTLPHEWVGAADCLRWRSLDVNTEFPLRGENRYLVYSCEVARAKCPRVLRVE